MQNQPLKPKHH